MKKYLALLKWAISKTPETAMAVLAALRISNWKAALDGTALDSFKVQYDTGELIVGLIKTRVLQASIVTKSGDAETVYSATTRFKNDGTDRLAINGEMMNFASFDFDLSGLTGTEVRIELRYTDLNGIAHELVISNKAIKLL